MSDLAGAPAEGAPPDLTELESPQVGTVTPSFAGAGVGAQAAEAWPDDAGVAGSRVALIVLASGTSTKVKAGSVLPEVLNFLEELRQHHPGAKGGR